jgi:hypothetical protein
VLNCVIAVLLNAVLALAWVLWREISISQKQAEHNRTAPTTSLALIAAIH